MIFGTHFLPNTLTLRHLEGVVTRRNRVIFTFYGAAREAALCTFTFTFTETAILQVKARRVWEMRQQRKERVECGRIKNVADVYGGGCQSVMGGSGLWTHSTR